MYPFSRSFSLSQVEGRMRYKYLVAQLLPPTFKSSAWRKIIWKNKEVCIYRTKFVSYLLLKLFKWSTFHQDEFQLERWPDVKWQDSKYWICCAFRKIVFFFFLVFFCFFKNKGQERYQQESQNRNGFGDRNVLIEE